MTHKIYNLEYYNVGTAGKRVIRSLPGMARAFLFLLVLCSASVGFGQTDPIDKALENGMARLAPNAAPFGKNADGSPYWPSSDPAFVQARPPVVSCAQPGAFSVSEMWNANKRGETRTVDSMARYLNDYPPGAKIDPVRTRQLISSRFTPDPATVMSAGAPQVVRTQTPDVTVQKLRKAYLLDIERHGRLVFEGKDGKALEIALKWQTIARLFPDRISEITMNVAARHGVSSFEGWINFVVSKDWQVARLQGLPPQIPIPAQTTSAPAAPAATIQVYDNKAGTWVEAGQVIYDAMVEQGSGKFGPSPGLYFHAGGTVGPTP